MHECKTRHTCRLGGFRSRVLSCHEILMPLKSKSPYLRVVRYLLCSHGVWVCFLTLLTPFHLLDLVHSALEDVALVRLDTETGNVAHVGWQKLSQLLDVAAFQLPPPFLQAAEGKETEWMCGQSRVLNTWVWLINKKSLPFLNQSFSLLTISFNKWSNWNKK